MDFVSINILDSTMLSICREMGITLMKTSYSTIFNEALDFTCGIASPTGEMLSAAEFCPAQIGGMPLLIRSCLQEIPLSDIEPGDVLVHNDPYRGGLHTPEHTLFCPVFVDGELVAFTVAIGHVAEVGGMVPGGFPSEATEIFHEGIRVPPVKIKKRGEDVVEVWKLWLANVRTPRHNYGDMRAMISGVELGAIRLAEIVRKQGAPAFRQHCADLLDYAERRMRAEIAEFPDGVYHFTDYMDNDGVSDSEIRIETHCYVMGDALVVDYTGSSPQVRGPINATLGVAWSAAYNAVLHLTDPGIPRNSGAFRPIKIIAPRGTVVNVDYPAPEVGGNTETHPRIAGAVIGALAQADLAPEVNQVERHPYLQQPELLAFCQANAIQLTAYAPLGSPPAGQTSPLLSDPVIAAIAAAHGTSAAQVLLAWGIACGTAVIPKSVHPQRLAANLAATQLTLGASDLAQITGLDRGERFIDGSFWDLPGGPYNLANLWDEPIGGV